MKRAAILATVSALLIALAAPIGAVFAEEASPLSEQTLVDSNNQLTRDDTVTVETNDENQAVLLDTLEQPQEESKSTVQVQSLVRDDQLLKATSATVSPVVAPASVVLPTSPLLITAYKASGAHVHAIQLYNNSSTMVALDTASVVYVAGGEEYEISLDGWIEARSYVVLSWEGESAYADIEFAFEDLRDTRLESIELYHDGYQPLIVTVAPTYSGELLHRFKSTAGNYTTNLTFAPGAVTISGGGLYVLPDAPSVSVREILVNPRACTYGLETDDCYDFIKLRNDGEEPLDLSLYRLRSGYSNTNSTNSNTIYFKQILAPGEVMTLTHDHEGQRVSFTANDGTVWLEDVYGFTSFDLSVPPYIDSDLTAQTGRSWAYNDVLDQWQWATPSPFRVDNDFRLPPSDDVVAPQTRELVPCRDDQYRSEETNRCRNISSGTTLTPCREGQYRSEETNRCRSIASVAASTLKPCADDQFRNPATNRCKKIASSDDVALADCGEGRERNPTTNRCRNVLASVPPTAGFAVEPVEEPASVFVGWWVLAGTALAAIGYAGWEWREEIGRFINKIRSPGTSHH